jgi:CBS domain containing-hemolysin-like protein
VTPVLAVVSGGVEGHGSFSLLAVGIGVALLFANGFFVAASIALLAARRSRVEEAADHGVRGAARALSQLTELSVTFTGAQLGITMCSLGLGLVAEPAVAALFSDLLGRGPLPAGLVPSVAFVLALSLVVFLHMVVGEMAPKNVSIARAERVAFRLARPFGWYVTAFRPLIVTLNVLANGLVRLVRVEPVDEHDLAHTVDELTSALVESDERGTISSQDARIMTAALRLSTIDAESAMTPRVDVHAVEDSASRREVLDLAARTGHTRFPVFRGDLDHVIGVVHVKDALAAYPDRADTTAADLLRTIPAVPESSDLEQLLQDMLDRHAHAVLVVDEHGGTAGFLTLEDVLEEVVGEIADEFDDDERTPRRTASVWVVPGLTRRDEIERLTDLELPDGDAETISGCVVELLGRLPRDGDRVELDDGTTLTVRGLDGFRAAEVEIRSGRTGPILRSLS